MVDGLSCVLCEARAARVAAGAAGACAAAGSRTKSAHLGLTYLPTYLHNAPQLEPSSTSSPKKKQLTYREISETTRPTGLKLSTCFFLEVYNRRSI